MMRTLKTREHLDLRELRVGEGGGGNITRKRPIFRGSRTTVYFQDPDREGQTAVVW